MNTPTALPNSPTSIALRQEPAGEVDLTQFSQLLAHTERLATLGMLAATIAHELNNPISVIISTSHAIRAELQEGDHSSSELEEYVTILEENAWRCARLIQSLRSYSHQQIPQRSVTHPRKIVENAVALVQHQFRDRDLTLQLDLPTDLPAVYWDENQISQVLINLLLNACDATIDGEFEGIIQVKAEHETETNSIIIEVTDNGPGVSPELQERVFEPFFTTKPLGEGTGLGLSIAAGIVKQHGGNIMVTNQPEGGASFLVKLPADTRQKNQQND